MPADLPEDYEQIAGYTDATLRERSGRGWAEWVQILDDRGAEPLDHAAIVDLVEPEIDRWWAQTIVVGYERLTGRRAVGQVAGGTFAASKSATLPVGLDRARQAFTQDERAAWLSIPVAERPTTSPSSLRFDLPDGTRAGVWFTEKGPSKVSLSVNLQGLPTADARDAAKRAWGEHLAALKAHVKASAG